MFLYIHESLFVHCLFSMEIAELSIDAAAWMSLGHVLIPNRGKNEKKKFLITVRSLSSIWWLCKISSWRMAPRMWTVLIKHIVNDVIFYASCHLIWLW